VASFSHFNIVYIAMSARTSLFRIFTDINVYRTGSLKYGKLTTRYSWIYEYIFYSAALCQWALALLQQCTNSGRVCCTLLANAQTPLVWFVEDLLYRRVNNFNTTNPQQIELMECEHKQRWWNTINMLQKDSTKNVSISTRTINVHKVAQKQPVVIGRRVKKVQRYYWP